MKTQSEAIAIVREFQEEIAAIYGDRLKGVYLYGSHARGEADEDSDIDVAVVLEGPVNQHEEIKRTGWICSNLSLKHNCVLMAFFLMEEEFESPPEELYRNIGSEGVRI